MRKEISSWGRYPAFQQTLHPCYWRDELCGVFADVVKQHHVTLAHGMGRSYGDSCLAASDQLLDMRQLDRLIAVDWNTGRLVAEAGVTLEDILLLSIPRGWFLAVTPGTAQVTLGGAVANDVHGKNHHVRGTFGHHIRGFGLVRSDSGAHWCSAQSNPELFTASIGGLGLTGIISHIELQLMPIRSSAMTVHQQRFDNLAEFFQLSTELDPHHEYSVAWVDCLASGQHAGRGVFMAADHARYGELQLSDAWSPAMSFTPPVSLINSLSLRAFNALYWRKAPALRQRVRKDYRSFFYPLDSISGWNRMYGPKGFQQYQCVIPHDHAQDAIDLMLQAIARANTGSFLAVLKRCGDMPAAGLLSFPMPGVSLALDFPKPSRLAPLFESLDAIVREANGRLYPAKDAHMSGDDFRRGYLEWETVEGLRDPAINSRFWQRVMQ